MPLETATYISDLVSTNPAVGDATNQGDDHLRLVKSVLKASFPNVNGAVSTSAADLVGGIIPVGGIIMWSNGVIPTNWALCDGGTHNSIVTPDLRDKFIVGAQNTYPVGTSGGSATTSSDGAHTHSGATGGHTLIAAEIPGGNGSGGAGSVIQYTTGTPDATQPHTHPISSDGAHTHTVTPPYYALCFIMRVA